MKYFLSLVFVLALIGCSSDTSVFGDGESVFDSSVSPVTDGSWYKPNLATSWQWQLSGVLNMNYAVDVYDVDLFDTNITTILLLHENGKKVICYFSAGSYEDWREDASSFPLAVKGEQMAGWDELWLDISKEDLAPIMRARLDLAQSKGCDGVEPDNMDGYTNSTGFALSAENQLAYNKFIANEARIRGLSVALKNDLDQIGELEPYFDFAVNEECFYYGECNTLQPFIDNNKSVFSAEYATKYQTLTSDRTSMCADSTALGFKTLVLPLNLDDSSRFSCQ